MVVDCVVISLELINGTEVVDEVALMEMDESLVEVESEDMADSDAILLVTEVVDDEVVVVVLEDVDASE